jgi:hypothetical protein
MAIGTSSCLSVNRPALHLPEGWLLRENSIQKRECMKKQSIFFLCMVFLTITFVGCGPNQVEQNATATAQIATSDAIKNSYFLTQTAEPTTIPLPTVGPDLRSSFDKCAQSGFGVRYVISGNNVSSVSLTMENDMGGTDQGDYKVPFCKSFSGFQLGDFLYISAQINSGSGSIKCQIYSGKTIISEASANGFASIATCSGISE